MARRYRPRPVEVEAMQWTGDRAGAEALRAWMDQRAHQYGFDWYSNWYSKATSPAALWERKSQRWCPVNVGDYVVAEPDGDGFYRCQRDIFEDRYALHRCGDDVEIREETP